MQKFELFAPCIAHPCEKTDNPDKTQGGCVNCAFSRNSITSYERLKEVISTSEYGCRMGGSILHFEGKLFMKVENAVFPESKKPSQFVLDAQKRLQTYVSQKGIM